jgi:hypothetical protein
MGDERQKSLLHMVSELFNAHAPCSKALEITISDYLTQGGSMNKPEFLFRFDKINPS